MRLLFIGDSVGRSGRAVLLERLPDLRRRWKLDFVVVQDIVMTETAQYADVVLPGLAFLEKEGTVSNTERRVQLMHKVVESAGDARDDWWILTQIANRMGAGWNYASAKEIFEEVRTVTPSYAGITYDRLEKDLTPVRSNPISVAITSAFEGGRR